MSTTSNSADPIFAEYEKRISRLMHRDGLSRNEAYEALAAKDPDFIKKFHKADNAYAGTTPAPTRLKDDDDDDDDDPDDDDDDEEETGVSAKQEFDTAFRAKIRGGCTGIEAARQIYRENPALREWMIAEANGRPAAAVPTSTSRLKELRAEYETKIQAKMALGLSRMKASATVCREHPELQREMCELATAARQRG